MKSSNLRILFRIIAILLIAMTGRVSAERVLTFPGTVNAVLPPSEQLKFRADRNFSVEFWMKPNESGTNLGAIFTSGDYATLTGGDGTNGGWGLYWQSGTVVLAIRPSISASGTPYGGVRGQPAAMTPGVWHHVAVDAFRNGSMTLWVDGVQKDAVNMASWTYFGRVLEGLGPYRIGSDPSGGNLYRGSIDELRIWGRTRAATEIVSSSRDRLALNGNEPLLLAYYKFNEATGSAASLGSIGSAANILLSTAVRSDDDTLAFGAPISTAGVSDLALTFNGTNQTVETRVQGGALAGNELSIEYWFKGSMLQSAVRIQSPNLWIVSGWVAGGNPATPRHLVNTAGTNNQLILACPPNRSPIDGLWHHVAMTWKSGATAGFVSYFDGELVVSQPAPAVPLPAIPASVWLGSVGGTAEFLRGTLDEVHIWNRQISAEEVRRHATIPVARLFGFEPGLVAYFSMNDGDATGVRDQVSGQLALFRNMGAANRVAQDGVTFREPELVKMKNPAAAGLWLGEVSLNAVNEASLGGTNAAPAGGQFDFNVLLHVNAAGEVRLLKDVTIMQKRNSASNLTEIVLVTDDAQLSNFEGVVKRAGRLVGVRHSSAFYQFEGTSLALDGGIGSALLLQGTNSVPATLPASPFKHRFHPVHKDPKDLKGLPYDILRRIEFRFRESKVLPGEGRERLSGKYRETITGLHKAPVVVEGDLRLERISMVSKLNDQ